MALNHSTFDAAPIVTPMPAKSAYPLEDKALSRATFALRAKTPESQA
jgi:hypothetical protein